MTIDWSSLSQAEAKAYFPAPLNCPRCGRFLAQCGSRAVPSPIHNDTDECWGRCKVHGWQEWLQ